MDAIVPQNRRLIAATPNRGGRLKRCSTRAKGEVYTRNKMGTRGKKRSVRNCQLPDEIVWEILVLLPVKSLLRFKTVCKAWRAIISDRTFISAQLQCSASKQELDPSFIINPCTGESDSINGKILPIRLSNCIRFYQWKQGFSTVEYIHAEDFRGEFSEVSVMAHCDGLVLVPTNTKLYLFNPATRESVTLPDSEHNKPRQFGIRDCNCFGLGLDPSDGEYKVVQAFYQYVDRYSGIRDMRMKMRMEMLNVGCMDLGWMEISGHLPYPVKKDQTGLFVNGLLFWHIDKRRLKQPPRGIVCLSLKDEKFSVTGLPDALDPALDDAFILSVLHGRELCLAACTSEATPVTMTIWTMSIEDGGLNSQWQQRYSIHVSDVFRPMAILPGNSGIILWKGDSTLYRYELTTSELVTLCEMDRMRCQSCSAPIWKNLFLINVSPYTESLVRITRELPWMGIGQWKCPFAAQRAEFQLAFSSKLKARDTTSRCRH